MSTEPHHNGRINAADLPYNVKNALKLDNLYAKVPAIFMKNIPKKTNF